MTPIDLRGKTRQDAQAVLRRHSGALPSALDLEGRPTAKWLDVGRADLQEAFFETSLERLLQRAPDAVEIWTDLDLLKRADLFAGTAAPSGFIFHIGRCGSTLLAKVLASVPRCVAIKEAAPFQAVLGAEHDPVFAQDRPAYIRGLVAAYGRRRSPDHTHTFIKFSSNHIKRLEQVRAAHPGVRWLFLYRDPYEIIPTSMVGPAWNIRNKDSAAGAFEAALPLAEVAAMSALEFSVRIRVSSFQIALANECGDCMFVDYAELRRENLPAILDFLGFAADGQERAEMAEQFRYDAKNDAGRSAFVPDGKAKRAGVTAEMDRAMRGELCQLYEALQQSARNITKLYPR